jgi:hypothetical protein
MRQCDNCGTLKYPNDDRVALKFCGGCRVVNYEYMFDCLT